MTARIQSLTSAWIDDYVTGICNGEFVAEHISAPSSLAGIRSYRRHALLASDVILCQPGSPARIAEDHLSFPSPQLVFFALDPGLSVCAQSLRRILTILFFDVSIFLLNSEENCSFLIFSYLMTIL